MVFLVTSAALDDGVHVWGAFTDRARADAYVAIWDAAVEAAIRDGKHGICHVGDLQVEEPPVDPVAPEVDRGLYLYPYLVRVGRAG